MARNYENEMKWAKEKLIRVEAKIDREMYSEPLAKIKKEIGIATLLKKAIALYNSNPELFKEDE